jgi:hypothetical protein
VTREGIVTASEKHFTAEYAEIAENCISLRPWGSLASFAVKTFLLGEEKISPP